jgi:hypothetical protein
MRCCWRLAALESYLRTGQQIDTIPVNIGAIPTSYSMFGKEVDIGHGVLPDQSNSVV